MTLRTLCLLVLTLTFASFVSGCATTGATINLGYTPVDRSFGRHSGPITLMRVDPPTYRKDENGKWIIGAFNNVHGVHQADLTADVTIGEWIGNALLRELQQAGFTASFSTAPPTAAAKGIVITDINSFLNINRGIATDETMQALKFDVELYQNGERVKAFTISSRENKTIPFHVSADELEKIMLSSLQDAMLQIIPEVITRFDTK